MYKSLFASIDVDGSGTIDSNELFTAMHETFPTASITRAEAIRMIEEADINSDGVLSFDEFSSIMSNAENLAGNWAKLNNSFLSQGFKSLREAGILAHSATRPLRDFGRQNSFDCPDTGLTLATPAMWTSAAFVYGMIWIAIANCVNIFSGVNYARAFENVARGEMSI